MFGNPGMSLLVYSSGQSWSQDQLRDKGNRRFRYLQGIHFESRSRRGVPEISDSAKPYTYYMFPMHTRLCKFNLKIRHSKNNNNNE